MSLEGGARPDLLVALNGALMPFPGLASVLFPSLAKVLFLNPVTPKIFAWSADTAAPCFGYDVNGSLGAYLVRQYGVGFYKQLLSNTTSTDSLQVLGNAIQQAGGPTLPVAVQRWGANIALLPADSPGGFGWPARTEQGFTLAAINGSSLASSRVLPTTVPVNLNARGHFPFLRQPDAQGTYQEQLRVPAGSTLTAVVR